MKTQIGLYVDDSIAEELRKFASDVGAPIGALAGLLLKHSLAKINREGVRAWAHKLPNVRGPLAGGLSKNERTTLAAMRRLVSSGEGAWKFPASEVAKESGLTPKHAYFALKALEARQMVSGAEDPSAGVDRWNRPIVSLWFLIGDSGEAVKEVLS